MSHRHCWACLTASDSYSLLWSLLCYAFSFCVTSSFCVPAPSKTQLSPRLYHMSTHHQNLQAASGTNLKTKKYHHWLRAAQSHKLLECTGKSNYMLALCFYFFPGHELLATPTYEIRTLVSSLSWVYSLLILRPLVSWAARVWILNEHEAVLLPVTVGAEQLVLVHNPGLGVFFFFCMNQPVQESQIQKFQHGWSSRLHLINKTVPVKDRLQATAVWFPKSRAWASHTALHSWTWLLQIYSSCHPHRPVWVDGSPSDSVLLLSSGVRKLSCGTAAAHKPFVFTCIYLQQ